MTAQQNKRVKSSENKRWMVDFSAMEQEIANALSQDTQSHQLGVVVAGEYVRNEIVGPWLMFRLELQKKGMDVPMLADLLKALDIHTPNLTAILHTALELGLPGREDEINMGSE
jgi:2-succinyl-5-enolpyruvyl-6-hydroxy-3-cyclohexene-1-carboxylate synthase